MAISLAPSITSSIVDLSTYVSAVPSTVALLAMISEKGEDNVLTFVGGAGSSGTSSTLANSAGATDFFVNFGNPNILYAGSAFSQGMYVASSFLKQSNNLYVIRVADISAAYANLFVTATIIDSTTGTTVTPAIASFENLINTGLIQTMVDSSSGAINYLLNNPGIDATAADVPLIAFYGAGRGVYYNNYQINISQHRLMSKRQRQIYVVDVFQKQTFTVDNSIQNPQYSIVASYEVSFDPTSVGSDGNSNYIEDIFNMYFKDIKCVTNKDALSLIVNRSKLISTDADYATDHIRGGWDATSNPFNFVSNIFNTYYDASSNFFTPNLVAGEPLLYGSEGNLFNKNGIVNEEVARQLLVDAYSGLLLRPTGHANDYETKVLDTQNEYFNLILDAGYPADVKAAISALADTRQDCLALIDNGDNNSAAAALSNRTTGGYFYNTKYTAIYEPYSQIYDPYTGKNIWITPIYHAAYIFAYTDNVSQPWFPPAGLNRGMINTIKKLRYSPNNGERDLFAQHQLNPIVKFNVGYSLFDQLTSLTTTSKLESVNVIRLVLYIKRALERFCDYYLFELNDATTWSQITNKINPFLKQIQNQRGLNSYSVEVGATEYEKSAGKIHVNVTLNPIVGIRQIDLQFFIM